MQRRLHLSINLVMDHDIFHTASQIHNGAQLFLQLLIGMMNLENPAENSGIVKNISPVGGKNVQSCGSYQRNILHDYLPAYTVILSQLLA